MVVDRVEVAGQDQRPVRALGRGHRPELCVLPGPVVVTAVRVARMDGQNPHRPDLGHVGRGRPLLERRAGQWLAVAEREAGIDHRPRRTVLGGAGDVAEALAPLVALETGHPGRGGLDQHHDVGSLGLASQAGRIGHAVEHVQADQGEGWRGRRPPSGTNMRHRAGGLVGQSGQATDGDHRQSRPAAAGPEERDEQQRCGEQVSEQAVRNERRQQGWAVLGRREEPQGAGQQRRDQRQDPEGDQQRLEPTRRGHAVPGPRAGRRRGHALKGAGWLKDAQPNR